MSSLFRLQMIHEDILQSGALSTSVLCKLQQECDQLRDAITSGRSHIDDTEFNVVNVEEDEEDGVHSVRITEKSSGTHEIDAGESGDINARQVNPLQLV